MKIRITFACLILIFLSCSDDVIINQSELSKEIKEIQNSLIGSWKTYQYSVILLQDIANGNEINIYPFDDPNLCEMFAETLPEQDFIDSYDVVVDQDVLNVTKSYRCSDKIQNLYWQIEKVTNNNFHVLYLILEKNDEGETIAVYQSMYSSIGDLVLELVYKNDHPPFTITKYRAELKR